MRLLLSVGVHRILILTRSADAYIRGCSRKERRDRKCHILIAECDVCADVGIGAPLRMDPKPLPQLRRQTMRMSRLLIRNWAMIPSPLAISKNALNGSPESNIRLVVGTRNATVRT
jgi:hypothetical protein